MCENEPMGCLVSFITGTKTVEEVVQLIESEAAENPATGYRRMQQVLLQTHGVAVKRDTVAVALAAVNPEASENRKKRRLHSSLTIFQQRAE